jgi:class 3 adenylate cyclase
MRCLQCHHENASDAKFCNQCAAPFAPLAVQSMKRETESEGRVYATLPFVEAILQREKRVTYRKIKYVFGLDDSLLSEIREELLLRQVAVDEEGKVLVWTGETPVVTSSVTTVPDQLAIAEPTAIPSPITTVASLPGNAIDSEANEPPPLSDSPPIEALPDEPVTVSEVIRSTPEAERRQLTVMFCDLADSTALSQELDPEDLREVIREYQHTTAEVIQQYEGHIAQYLGDGLLIYFGWPGAHEDDAQRALHAGLGIVEAMMTTLNPHLKHEYGVQLTVRLGIHTGPVVVGEMGGGDRLENLATGETVNIAARLEGLAQPNTVVISSVTARLVQEKFRLEDLGPHELKGVTEPMAVFRVLGPSEMRRDEDESVPNSGVVLVGRDEEIGLLRRRWEQSRDGPGQVVLLTGEAGIGKSSLVTILRDDVGRKGAIRITLRCSPYHANSALHPIIEHLQYMTHWRPDVTPDEMADRLEQVLHTTRWPLAEAVPLIAELLALSLPPARYEPLRLSPQQRRQQTYDLLVAWLLEEAECQPVLIVWEDLHWADPSTLELLGVLIEQTPTVPMLQLLTCRPEFTSPWPSRSHLTSITLNRLERLQVEALITQQTNGKALPVDVVEHIVAKTDGVPLYVEELTKMLVDSDLLREEVDQYMLTGPLTTMSIPDTLQDSLMARLDQLNTAKELPPVQAEQSRATPCCAPRRQAAAAGT